MACRAGFSLLAQVLIFSILLAIAEQAASKRDIPKSKKNADVKHPEFLVTIEPQPTVLIPGVGRFLLPPKCKGKKSLYPTNPVTGEPITGGSISGQIPVGGGQGMGGGRQIPGGDDTFVPNPGSEVPAPGSDSGSSSGTGTGMGTGSGTGVPPLPHP